MTSQDNSIEQLIRLVERETELYEDLLKVTFKQREALVRNTESAIAQTAAEQDRLLRQISATERSSQAFAARLAQGSDPNIGDIAARADEPHSSRLLEAAGRLLDAGTRVRGENMINRHLINNLLELTDFCLRTLAGEGSCSPYRIDGKAENSSAATRWLLDSRA